MGFHLTYTLAHHEIIACKKTTGSAAVFYFIRIALAGGAVWFALDLVHLVL